MSRTPLLLLVLTALGCPAPSPKDTDTHVVDPDPTPDDSGAPNHAPSTPVVAITPASPADGDDSTVTLLTPSVDPDGDPVSYRYAWARNGTPDAAPTTESVGADLTSDGDTWSVSVTPSDGTLDGDAATASVTIGNGAPSAPVLHIDPTRPAAGDALTLVVDTPAVDPDGDVLTETITWYVDGAHAVSWDGATGVDGNQVDSGETFRVVVAVTDGKHDPVSAEASVTVDNNPPVIDDIAVTPTSPEDDDDLRVRVRSSDPDGDSLATSYRWFRDGVEATDVGDTNTVDAGFTSPTEIWYVTATVSDGAAAVSMDSDPVAIATPTLIRYGHYLDGIATGGASDGTWDAMTGTWEVSLQTEGAMYGHVDCDAFYDVASTSTARCPGCEYAFDITITYDAAASTMNTPGACVYMEEDGTGTVSMDRYGYVEFQGYGPGIGVYYYGVPYSFGGYMYWYVYGTYEYSGPGYAMSMGASTSEDTAGDLHLSAWRYVYVSY